MPIIYGTFSFQTEFIIRPLTGVKFLEEILTVQKSFPIRSKGYTIATFPFALKSRGVAKIRNITYAFPHLFNFHILRLKYSPFYISEVVMIPKPLKVMGLQKVFQQSPGNHPMQLSPFEELQHLIGTRDYIYSDPFYRVNWKASAKLQQL